MTSVLCLPVAEQYPSRTATSDESTSTRVSVTDMSSGLARRIGVSLKLVFRQDLNLVLPKLRNGIAPMRNGGNVLDPKLLGYFFPTAEKVDHVLCFHSEVIMSALTVKGKRYFSPDDYHCLMAVMNIVKEAREKKGYNQSELARITFASLGLAEIPGIDAINISQTVSVLKLLLTLTVSGLMMNTSQQHSKPARASNQAIRRHCIANG